MKQIALSLFVMTASGAHVWEHARQTAAGELLATASASDLEPAAAVDLAPVLELQPRLARTALPVATPDVAVPAQPAPRHPLTGAAAAAIVRPVVDRTATAAIGRALPQSASTFMVSAAKGISATSFTRSAVAASLPETAVPIPRPRPAEQPHLSKAKDPIAARLGLVAGGAYSDGLYIGPATDAYYGTIQIEAVIQGGALVGIKVLQYPSDRRTSVRINHQALPMLRDEAVSAQSENVDIISGATLTSRAFIRSLGGALRQAAS